MYFCSFSSSMTATQVNLRCLKMVPMNFSYPKNLGIDTKNKSLACSEQKLEIWPCFEWPKWLKMSIYHLAIWPLRLIWSVLKRSQWISHARKPGDTHQKQVFSMFRTKVGNLAMFSVAEMAKNGHLATQVNPSGLKMVPMNFSYPKTWG